MSFFKKLVAYTKNPAVATAGIYTFTNFFSKGVAFLLLFIYSNPLYISVTENGLLSLLSSSMLFLTPFISLGIIQSSSTDFFKLDQSEFKNFFTTGFILPIFVTLLSVLVFFLLHQQLYNAYNFPKSFIWIIPLATFFIFFNEQFTALIRNNNEPQKYLKSGLLKLFIEIGLSLALVVYFNWRWQGRVAGILTSQLVICIWGYLYFRRKGYLFGKIKMKYLKSELIFALPIILMQTSIFFMIAADKFFLAHYTDNKSVGIYAYACTFASVVNIFCSALLQYLFPKIYSFLSAEKVNYNAIRKNFIVYAVGTLASTVGIIIITPFLYHYFINENYHPGLQYMYIIAIGYYLWGISYFFYSYMLFHKQKKKILLLSAVSILISLASNTFFISRYSSFGAAIGVCCTYFVVLVITLLVSGKYVINIFKPNSTDR
jgi:O-antigen/teichoic acid export membrane protein